MTFALVSFPPPIGRHSTNILPFSAIWLPPLVSVLPLANGGSGSGGGGGGGGGHKQMKVTHLAWRERQNCPPRGSKKHAGVLLVLLVAFVALLMVFNTLHLASIHRDDPLLPDWETNTNRKLKVETIVVRLENLTKAPEMYMVDTRGTGDSTPFTTTNFGRPRWPELFVEALPLPVGHPCRGFTVPPPPADKKRTGPRPCPVCYLPVEEAIKMMPSKPSTSPVIKKLTFVVEGNSSGSFQGHAGSNFGGHPTLEQRNKNFQVEESMRVHCGFARGSGPGARLGFDIENDDLVDMEKCRGIVVASAIFGNYDKVKQPKNISEAAANTVCFYMFLDRETYRPFEKNGLVDNKQIGMWRIVVVRNLPYSDPRRNGKIPKLLLHRLFPNVRFSLWIDGKLGLVVDPYQILERFLWRTKDTFAISQHYKRFDVFEEAEANKAAGKYDNTSIDAQIRFYQKEGLTPFNTSKFPIISDVPEGCVIIREHIPITNLFTCLWFNEVDRFTSRDQISFAIVRDKLMSKVPWKAGMFRDCERRNFVVQAYHRDLLERLKALRIPRPPFPPLIVNSSTTNAKLGLTSKHGQSEGGSLQQQPPRNQSSSLSPNRALGRRVRERHGKQRRHVSKTSIN